MRDRTCLEEDSSCLKGNCAGQEESCLKGTVLKWVSRGGPSHQGGLSKKWLALKTLLRRIVLKRIFHGEGVATD
jgi:hypothetical protein